jgi:hypothetical protein
MRTISTYRKSGRLFILRVMAILHPSDEGGTVALQMSTRGMVSQRPSLALGPARLSAFRARSETDRLVKRPERPPDSECPD